MPVIVNSFSAHGAFPLSLTMGDDHYFDARADESQRIPASHYPMGRGHVWLCGEDDIDDAFLGTFAVPPLVITCKDRFVDHVVKACIKKGCENILFNVGFHQARMDHFFDVHVSIKEALDEGKTVILHCRRGIHRAKFYFKKRLEEEMEKV